MNSRGILIFDWPRATLLSSGGLHYAQESFDVNMEDIFLKGSSPEVKFLGQSSKPRTRNLTSGELQLEKNTSTLFSSSFADYHSPLITLSWAKILDRPVHFSNGVESSPK